MFWCNIVSELKGRFITKTTSRKGGRTCVLA